ncbi:hypothetical protein PVL29_026174 [Vitis rotundifolia]|uniref:Uncharacterized protein n=1 Tax=Vitis rotundifolia TaxID=103349 RepID=A0AA38YLT6_VITRO|nr:hypothetical protein PVL29_026174 [Vitis rotundifolia]
MSSIEGIFSSNLGVVVTTIAKENSMGIGARASSGQAFLEGVGLTTMDSDGHLRCLSRYLTLKFEAISSSSSSSSQIMGGTTRSTSVLGSLLEVEEDEDDEDDETDKKDGDAGGRVLAL